MVGILKTKGYDMFDDFDTQVQPEEMNFDLFTPEERLEFESVQDEISQEDLEAAEELWDSLLPGA